MGLGEVYYCSYLLRMWLVPTHGEHNCRIQLENVQTNEKFGFTSCEELFAYLKQITKLANKPSGEGRK